MKVYFGKGWTYLRITFYGYFVFCSLKSQLQIDFQSLWALGARSLSHGKENYKCLQCQNKCNDGAWHKTAKSYFLKVPKNLGAENLWGRRQDRESGRRNRSTSWGCQDLGRQRGSLFSDKMSLHDITLQLHDICKFFSLEKDICSVFLFLKSSTFLPKRISTKMLVDEAKIGEAVCFQTRCPCIIYFSTEKISFQLLNSNNIVLQVALIALWMSFV